MSLILNSNMKKYLVIIACIMLLASCSNKTRHAYKSSSGSSRSNSSQRTTPKNTTPEKAASGVYVYEQADRYTNNKRLSQFVNDWLSTPHLMGGKSKAGVDCSGFTSVLYATVFHKTIKGSSAEMADMVQKIEPEDLQEGDLVFFKIGSSRVSHVGVYLSQSRFAHATLKRGVMISSLNEPYYQRYFSSAGRIVERNMLSDQRTSLKVGAK